jgi:glycosyltransferase involved in cell wall biosynthesis
MVPSVPSVPVAPALPAQGLFTFGMVSRGVPEKGWQEALEAFARVQQQTTQPCRLVLVGGGAHLHALQQQLSATLRPHIHFAGAQADPRPWIESFDVALLPSYFAAESLPNVIIECLAQGKPVIATRIGGIPDMLNTPTGPCGLLVPLNAETQRAEVPALAHAMRQLMTNPEQRQALAERAPLAVARYHPHVIASALADFIQQLAIATVRPSAAPSLTQALVA